MKNAKELAPNGVYNELKKFHVDTVNVTNQASMSAMTKFLPISNILYGTDYFYFNNDQLDELDGLHLSPKDLAAIQSGNAKRMIPRLAKA
jgi:predicted TIM-barrel fold metal-dependent hydrolase